MLGKFSSFFGTLSHPVKTDRSVRCVTAPFKNELHSSKKDRLEANLFKQAEDDPILASLDAKFLV